MQISSQEGDAASATPVRLGAGHLAGLEAVGAHVHLLALAIDHAVHALDVGTELTVGHAVGVADGATSNGVLTADFANFGHIETLLGRSGTTHLIKQIGTIAQNTGNASNLHEQIPAFCPRTCYAYRQAPSTGGANIHERYACLPGEIQQDVVRELFGRTSMSVMFVFLYRYLQAIPFAAVRLPLGASCPGTMLPINTYSVRYLMNENCMKGAQSYPTPTHFRNRWGTTCSTCAEG